MTEYQEEVYHKLCNADIHIHLTSFSYVRTDVILINYLYLYLEENRRRIVLISCNRSSYRRWSIMLSRLFKDKLFLPEEY